MYKIWLEGISEGIFSTKSINEGIFEGIFYCRNITKGFSKGFFLLEKHNEGILEGIISGDTTVSDLHLKASLKNIKNKRDNPHFHVLYFSKIYEK